jgi:hypothetical protein
MQKLLCCFLFSIVVLAASSQTVYVETGKILSSFNYKNSHGNALSNLKGSNQNNLGLGFRKPINQSNFHYSFGLAYNKYGAMGSDPILGNYYEWGVTYLGVNAGLDYEFFKPLLGFTEQHGFSFHIKTSIASEFLLDGTQNLNDQIYDLQGQEEFDKPFYFVRGGIGINYYLSRTYVLFAEYMGGTSVLIGNYSNKEQLRIITQNFSIGFSINLFYIKQ